MPIEQSVRRLRGGGRARTRALVLVVWIAGEALACRPRSVEWPEWQPLELTPVAPPRRRLQLPSAYEAFLRGQIAFNNGDFDEAARQFRVVLRSDESSAYVYVWVARAELARRRWAQARSAVDAALALDSCSEFALCTAADILLQEADRSGAMRALERAIACEPRQPEAYLQLAGLFEAQGAAARAEAVYQRLLQARPRWARAHQELARLALARGASAVAAQHLESLLMLEPWHIGSAKELARLQRDAGQTVAARELLETIVGRRPRDDEARRLLVEVLLASGNPPAAARLLDGFRPESDDVSSLASLAELALRARRWDQARIEARRALDRDPSHPGARWVLAASLRRQGRVEEAVRWVESLDPASAGADRATVEAAAGLWESCQAPQARRMLERQLAAAPTSSRSRAFLARLLEAEGEFQGADLLLRAGGEESDQLALAAFQLRQQRPAETAALLEPVTRRPVAPTAALLLRARALLALESSGEDVSRLLSRARGQSPNDPEVWLVLGEWAFRQGDERRALAWLRRATDQLPLSARAQALLAEALARAGDASGAREAAVRALRRRPHPSLRPRLEALAQSSQE